MKPSIRVGLTVGVIGLALVVVGSAFSGLCSLILPILVYAIAGYSSIDSKKVISKGNGARYGAIAGAVSGGIVSHAQILIQAILSTMINYSPAFSGLYIAPSPFNTTERIFFYLIGLFWAIVIGGIVGGVVGYLGTSQKPIE